MLGPGEATLLYRKSAFREAFDIEDFGQASSCRIRREEGREILYITELRSPRKDRKAPEQRPWRAAGCLGVAAGRQTADPGD